MLINHSFTCHYHHSSSIRRSYRPPLLHPSPRTRQSPHHITLPPQVRWAQLEQRARPRARGRRPRFGHRVRGHGRESEYYSWCRRSQPGGGRQRRVSARRPAPNRGRRALNPLPLVSPAPRWGGRAAKPGEWGRMTRRGVVFAPGSTASARASGLQSPSPQNMLLHHPRGLFVSALCVLVMVVCAPCKCVVRRRYRRPQRN